MALLSSISPVILPQVAGLTSSAKIWTALERIFASKSRIRILHLRQQLQSLKKGTLKVGDYISHIQTIADALAIAGEQVNDEELTLLTLSGLGPEFESFVTSVTTRGMDLTFLDLQGLLLNQEIRMDRLVQNEATRFANVGKGNINQNNTNTAQGNNMQRYGGNYNRDEKVVMCQICNRKGHSALNCYSPINLQRFPPKHGRKLQVNLVGFCTGEADASCYPDSGASTHITNDLDDIQDPRSKETLLQGQAHDGICRMKIPIKKAIQANLGEKT